jgi:argininosuccinate lyase
MANFGRLAQDLLLWCNPALGFLKLSDAWVQISSIMPQKRNPVALEHARILASRTLGQAQAVFTCVHNTPFGDVVDSEDDLQPLVFATAAGALRALRLFAGLMNDCAFDVGRMARQANANFLTVTELADTLVRREGVSFHDAHALVSAAVRRLGTYSPEAMVDAVTDLAPHMIGRAVTTPHADLLKWLDPQTFVAVRNIPGGPGPQAIETAISEAARDLDADELWVREKSALLDNRAHALRHQRPTELR